MPQSMTTATELLKEVFIPRISELMDSEPTTYNRIKSTAGNAAKFGGKWVEFPVHIERNTGIGARPEGGALPSAGQQKWRETRLGLKPFYGAIELTGPTFDLATSDYQSFASVVTQETTGIKNDLMVDRNRQVYGNGLGTLATVASIAGQVITLSTTGDKGVWRFQDGMAVDVMVGSSSTIRQQKLYVTDIDINANTVTVSGTVTGIAAGDIFVRNGNYNNEWTGLNAIIDDTTSLYGIAPTNGAAGSRLWRGQVMNQGGTPTEISDLTMVRMADRIKFNGGKTSAIYSSPGVFRKYWQLIKTNQRFVNTTKFDGGYTGLTFNTPAWGEIPFLSDDQANSGTMYFVEEKDLSIYRPSEYKMMDRGGSTWHQKQDANGVYDVWQAWLVEYSEMGCQTRNHHGKITNIIEDAY